MPRARRPVSRSSIRQICVRSLDKVTGADHYAPIFHEVRNGQFQAVTKDPAGQRAVQVVLDAIATRRHTSSDQ
jgi:hypothetical protein